MQAAVLRPQPGELDGPMEDGKKGHTWRSAAGVAGVALGSDHADLAAWTDPQRHRTSFCDLDLPNSRNFLISESRSVRRTSVDDTAVVASTNAWAMSTML